MRRPARTLAHFQLQKSRWDRVARVLAAPSSKSPGAFRAAKNMVRAPSAGSRPPLPRPRKRRRRSRARHRAVSRGSGHLTHADLRVESECEVSAVKPRRNVPDAAAACLQLRGASAAPNSKVINAAPACPPAKLRGGWNTRAGRRRLRVRRQLWRGGAGAAGPRLPSCVLLFASDASLSSEYDRASHSTV